MTALRRVIQASVAANPDGAVTDHVAARSRFATLGRRAFFRPRKPTVLPVRERILTLDHPRRVWLHHTQPQSCRKSTE